MLKIHGIPGVFHHFFLVFPLRLQTKRDQLGKVGKKELPKFSFCFSGEIQGKWALEPWEFWCFPGKFQRKSSRSSWDSSIFLQGNSSWDEIPVFRSRTCWDEIPGKELRWIWEFRSSGLDFSLVFFPGFIWEFIRFSWNLNCKLPENLGIKGTRRNFPWKQIRED